MIKVIGKCSLCGGDVTLPDSWLGIYPPKPHCQKCGAVAKDDGPVIPMAKPKCMEGKIF